MDLELNWIAMANTTSATAGWTAPEYISSDIGGNVYSLLTRNDSKDFYYFHSNNVYSDLRLTKSGSPIFNYAGGVTFHKHDINGNILWKIDIDTTPNDQNHDYGQLNFGLDTISGNIYVVTGAANYGTTYIVTNITHANGVVFRTMPRSDGIVASWDTYGTVRWVANIGDGYINNPDNTESVSYAAHYYDGNVYCSGTMRGNTNINSNVVFYNSDLSISNYKFSATGNIQGFIAKYTNTGNVLWAANIGSELCSVRMFDLITDTTGNIYITGKINNKGPCSFFNSNGTFASIKYTTEQDYIITKYSTDGNFIWAANISNIVQPFTFVTGITNDENNDVYFSYVNSSNTIPKLFTLFNANGTVGVSASCRTGIAKYDSAGTAKWLSYAANAGPVGSGLIFESIQSDKNGYLYAALNGYNPIVKTLNDKLFHSNGTEYKLYESPYYKTFQTGHILKYDIYGNIIGPVITMNATPRAFHYDKNSLNGFLYGFLTTGNLCDTSGNTIISPDIPNKFMFFSKYYDINGLLAPQNISAKPSIRSIDLSFNNVNNATNYIVYLSSLDGTNQQNITSNVSTIYNLSGNTSYNIQLRAKNTNTNNQSSLSSVVSATPYTSEEIVYTATNIYTKFLDDTPSTGKTSILLNQNKLNLLQKINNLYNQYKITDVIDGTLNSVRQINKNPQL